MDKKRGKRVSNEQKKIIVDFISENRIILSGKCHPLQVKELEEKWSLLTNLLNSETNGAKKDTTQWKHEALYNFAGTVPGGVSLKQMEHYAQITYSKYFRQFDYGRKENMKKYNNTIPPNYNLTRMDVPAYIYIGQNDIIVTLQDTKTLSKVLPNVKELYIIPIKNFNHLDYLLAQNADELMYNKIITTIANYQNKVIKN